MIRPLKIANASGFWGDQPDAAARLVTQQPDLDVITFDYLAEVSLSIMAIIRSKEPGGGYAKDFVDVIRTLCPFWTAGGTTKLVSNAGGLDPEACAKACLEVLRAAGLGPAGGGRCRRRRAWRAMKGDGDEFANLETGDALATVAHKLVTANAYLGAGAYRRCAAGRAPTSS